VHVADVKKFPQPVIATHAAPPEATVQTVLKA
jgi:hypothetical protein